jgi:hypothetical protein
VTSSVQNVAFDCPDPHRLALFWSRSSAARRAQYRRLAHERARLHEAIVRVLQCGDGPDTGDLFEFAVDEVRAALGWTRRAADTACVLAYDLVTRLPAVHAAMLAGDLDEPRARIFSQWTSGLTDLQATAVCAALVPQAPAGPPGS